MHPPGYKAHVGIRIVGTGLQFHNQVVSVHVFHAWYTPENACALRIIARMSYALFDNKNLSYPILNHAAKSVKNHILFHIVVFTDAAEESYEIE